MILMMNIQLVVENVMWCTVILEVMFTLMMVQWKQLSILEAMLANQLAITQQHPLD